VDHAENKTKAVFIFSNSAKFFPHFTRKFRSVFKANFVRHFSSSEIAQDLIKK